MTKRVGLVGVYGKGLLLDDLLCVATQRLIHSVDPDIEVSIYAPEEQFDLIVVGGGTVIERQLVNKLEYARRKGIPVVCVGTGVRVGVHSDVSYFKVHDIPMGVRGLVSQEILGYGTVVGDLIYSLPLPSLNPEYDMCVVVRGHELRRHQRAIDEWCSQFKPSICLSFTTISAVQDDQYAATRLFPGIEVVTPTSPQDILPLIGKCKCVASSRLHPFLLATAMGIGGYAMDLEFHKLEDATSILGIWPQVSEQKLLTNDERARARKRMSELADIQVEFMRSNLERWT